MKKAILYSIIVTIALCIVIMGNLVWGIVHSHLYPYVAGKTGQKCYLNGWQHANVKYMKYFRNLEDCENYIKLPLNKR